MTTYYKGYLAMSLNNEKIRLGRLDLNLKTIQFSKVNTKPDKITKEEQFVIANFIYENLSIMGWGSISNPKRTDVSEILEKIIEVTGTCEIILEKIIFEKIKDKYGNYYGKELITGLLFPLPNVEKNISREYGFSKNEKTYEGKDIYLHIKKSFSFETMSKCEVVITDSEVADNNEINEYQTKYRKGLKTKKFVKKITEWFNNNVFNSEIEQAKEKVIEKKSQSIETKIMENIEFQLRKIIKINQELYSEFKSKYELLLSNKNITIHELASLEGEIEFYLMFNKKGTNSMEEYFESLKKEYLENNLNKSNIQTTLNLDDIDKMEELFLKTKDEYSLSSQRKILKDIAFIYLMEVYENIDNISVDRLRESYFSTNLKTILLIIESLRDLGIIKNELVIDLTKEITLENIINIIRRIKFNDIERENVHKLIKSI